MLFLGKFRSNACVLFLFKTFCVCFFQLCFLAYSQARMSACIESSYWTCNTNNQPFYRSSQVSGLLKFFGYASWISYFAILSTCEDKKENRFEHVKTKPQKCSRIEAMCRFAYWSWWICVNVRRVKREENLKSTNVAYIPDFPTQHLVSWETLDQGKEWHC